MYWPNVLHKISVWKAKGLHNGFEVSWLLSEGMSEYVFQMLESFWNISIVVNELSAPGYQRTIW